MSALSAYVLTYNSEQYLAEILAQISPVVEEIVVVDSGSEDRTESIVAALPNARFVYHTFNNFKEQRNFAANSCRFEHILFLDSDELPDADFIASIAAIKAEGFPLEAYRARRHWEVMGQSIHCIYPIVSPDYPVRLFDRRKVNFDQANIVHESPSGWDSIGMIEGRLRHISFHDQAELSRKLEQYTELAAQRLLSQGKSTRWHKAFLSAIAAWVKWYLLKGGFRDGRLGIRLGVYAFQYSWKKYRKAQKMNERTSPNL